MNNYKETFNYSFWFSSFIFVMLRFSLDCNVVPVKASLVICKFFFPPV